MTVAVAVAPQKNSARRVLAASMIGTTIEFFDFYIYATAAVIVFPHLFFPASDGNSALLQSLATFAIAFFARPIGGALFGHFGDKVGRKATLVAALMTMGISTVAIGFLPTYDSIGVWAALLLALCRLGGDLVLAVNGVVQCCSQLKTHPKASVPVRHVPAAWRASWLHSGNWHLPRSGRSSHRRTVFAFGWRIPFIASALLVGVGLFIRLKIAETPEFQKAIDKAERVEVPVATLFKKHKMSLFLGTIGAVATFVLFYLMTVFSLGWGTRALGYSREEFLILQMIGVIFFGLMIPVAAPCCQTASACVRS